MKKKLTPYEKISLRLQRIEEKLDASIDLEGREEFYNSRIDFFERNLDIMLKEQLKKGKKCSTN